jgi:sirohydrochlorin cobaltochelatase
MAGEDDESWLSAFKTAGYEVVTILKGLGEMEAIQQLYVKHAQEAIGSLAS